MAEKLVLLTIFVVFCAETVDSQFFDLFQIGHKQPSRSIPSFLDDFTTRRTKVETRKTTKRYDDFDIPYEVQDYNRRNQYNRDKGKRKTTAQPYTTTEKLYRKTKPKRRDSTTGNRRNQSVRASDYYNYVTETPTHDNNNHNYDYNNNINNYYTTQNPLYVRPGVKPAVIDVNRPPITNRPATRRTTTRYTTRRPETDSIVFPMDTDDAPEVMLGRDEDRMSETERRRYIDIAEEMCEKYKSLSNKQVQAIPLIPSPEPVQVNVSSCTPTNVPLVVGGKVVSITEFPHMALLGWVKLEDGGYLWKCGGSLISDRWVLTAAHCAYQERDDRVSTGPPRAVQLGSSYLDDPGALVVKVSTVVRHPKYKAPTSYFDIALLKLVKSVKFSEVIKPACLGVPPRVGSPIIATGWGKTEFGDQSQELRSVSVPVWGMNECRRVLGTSRKLPDGPRDDSQMCAGEAKGGKDTCQGDSGGPAQIQEGCTWRVVSVTSLGRACGAPQTPGVYATLQRAFIASHVFGDYSYSHAISSNNRPQHGSSQNNNNRWTENNSNGADSYNNQHASTNQNKDSNWQNPGSNQWTENNNNGADSYNNQHANTNQNKDSNWQNSGSNQWNENKSGQNSGSWNIQGSSSNNRNDFNGSGNRRSQNNNFDSERHNDYSNHNSYDNFNSGSQSSRRSNHEGTRRSNEDQYHSYGSGDFYTSSTNKNLYNNRENHETSSRGSNRRNPSYYETETDSYRGRNQKQSSGQNENIYDKGNVWWT